MFKKMKGLTLVELMISIAVISIIITVVGPSANSMLVHSRLTSEINDVSALAQLARFTAINEQAPVTLCPTSDFSRCDTNWLNAKMVYLDLNDNDERDTDEPIIGSAQANNTQHYTYGLSSSLIFDENGGINTSTTLIYCPHSQEASDAVGLIITTYGRISVAKDSDNDGTKETYSGANISCS
jgi:type IV fimbrial biogenesis protein FimT